MSQASGTFKCDRDGATATVIGPGLPPGWSFMNFFMVRPLSLHFCPTCTTALEAFINASGAHIDLTPSPSTE